MSRRWAPPALWAVFILVLTSLPGAAVPDVGDVPSGTDKLLHAGVYGILGWLAARALRSREPRRLVLLLLGITALAALDEWHQGFIPGREPNVWDWVADVSGATIGVALGAIRNRQEQQS